MRIKGLEIKGNLFLAPMCEVTNLPYRLLCRKYGAAVVYTEMVNANAIVMGSDKTIDRAKINDSERPVGVQIFGSEEKYLVEAAKMIEEKINPDLIDINIGCPAYDVMKIGSGASLLNDKDKLYSLISSVSSNLKIPLTCKMRVTEDDKRSISIAKAIEAAGASLLTVHGRTAKQGYRGKARWDIIQQIKTELSIPVVLNGDVHDEISAKKALEDTGCDGLMIGRAAIGNPYIFKRIKHFLDKGKLLPERTNDERVKEFLEYIDLCLSTGTDDLNMIKIQAISFTKGLVGGGSMRQDISRSKDIRTIKGLFLKIIGKNGFSTS